MSMSFRPEAALRRRIPKGQKPNHARYGQKIYIHILKWLTDIELNLPALGRKIVKSRLLTGGEVEMLQEKPSSNVNIKVPTFYQKEIATIVEIELDGSLPIFKTPKTAK